MRSLLQVLCLVLATVTLLAACESQESNRITANDIRNNLNPEFFTSIRSWEQRQNYDAIVRNIEGRQMVDDWYTLWLADPSRLTPYPSLY